MAELTEEAARLQRTLNEVEAEARLLRDFRACGPTARKVAVKLLNRLAWGAANLGDFDREPATGSWEAEACEEGIDAAIYLAKASLSAAERAERRDLLIEQELPPAPRGRWEGDRYEPAVGERVRVTKRLYEDPPLVGSVIEWRPDSRNDFDAEGVRWISYSGAGVPAGARKCLLVEPLK